ncbi:hypothetical protein [Campylobacter lari]|uniref:hypothetical protein n=1 Tax=Campylobacter lari TaxID=201 RepID=UPI00069A9918|nr:hypothetical protein [Campylobacter lari]
MMNEQMNENDALNELLNSLNDNEETTQNKEEEQEVEQVEQDEQNNQDLSKLLKEQANEIKTLKESLALLNNKNKPSKEEEERKEYLKQLGLGGIDERLKKLDELEAKAKQKDEEESLRAKYMEVERTIRKEYPNADLKTMGELANKLGGLASGDLQSWRTLLAMVYKKDISKKADESLPRSNYAGGESDFNSKIKKGDDISNIDLGKELLSLA